MWIIEKSILFEKWLEKESVDRGLTSRLEMTLLDFRRESTKRTKPIFRKDFYEIWDIHVPDKKNNTGKSSGFRMMLKLNFESKKMIFEVIIRRQHLDWRRSKGKHQDKWGNYLQEFKKKKNFI